MGTVDIVKSTCVPCGGEVSGQLEEVAEEHSDVSAISRSSSSSRSSQCKENGIADLPSLDRVQTGSLAGELADAAKDLEIPKEHSAWIPAYPTIYMEHQTVW